MAGQLAQLSQPDPCDVLWPATAGRIAYIGNDWPCFPLSQHLQRLQTIDETKVNGTKLEVDVSTGTDQASTRLACTEANNFEVNMARLLKSARVAFCIHNLAYQGIFPQVRLSHCILICLLLCRYCIDNSLEALSLLSINVPLSLHVHVQPTCATHMCNPHMQATYASHKCNPHMQPTSATQIYPQILSFMHLNGYAAVGNVANMSMHKLHLTGIPLCLCRRPFYACAFLLVVCLTYGPVEQLTNSLVVGLSAPPVQSMRPPHMQCHLACTVRQQPPAVVVQINIKA